LSLETNSNLSFLTVELSRFSYWLNEQGLEEAVKLILIYQIAASDSKLKGVKAAEPIFLKFFTALT
jgi:hypothetical protein